MAWRENVPPTDVGSDNSTAVRPRVSKIYRNVDLSHLRTINLAPSVSVNSSKGHEYERSDEADERARVESAHAGWLIVCHHLNLV